MRRRQQREPRGPCGQGGVAAVEFAFIAVLMIVMLLGLFVWWRYFQTQQILVRAAGDGARLAHSLIAEGASYPCNGAAEGENQASQAAIRAGVEHIVRQGLQQNALPVEPLSIGAFVWSCGEPGSVSFVLNYQLPPLLGNTGLLGEPRQLNARSVVHFKSTL